MRDAACLKLTRKKGLFLFSCCYGNIARWGFKRDLCLNVREVGRCGLTQQRRRSRRNRSRRSLRAPAVRISADHVVSGAAPAWSAHKGGYGDLFFEIEHSNAERRVPCTASVLYDAVVSLTQNAMACATISTGHVDRSEDKINKALGMILDEESALWSEISSARRRETR